ncbi:MAG: hypothetical protein P4M08_15720 [Oligoflexia bacterium]|nr:hypothetical protein [Oligoflexia bacterium]
MEDICVSCRSSRADTECGLCGGAVCRKCRVFLSEEEFPFAPERPPELRHSYYCGACYSDKVEPFKDSYEATIEQAKGINVLFKNSKSSVRVLRKASAPVRVENGADRDDVILKLAFQAASGGYNAVVDVEVSVQKVRNEGWQKSAWSGSGIPAEIVIRERDQ